MSLMVRPISVKEAIRWNQEVHRRLPRLQGGMWAVQAIRGHERVGVAIVGHPARVWMVSGILTVLRVAVLPDVPNGCSILYGSCSRAARAMGATSLVTYTHIDEPGTSLKAAGWIDGGLTKGGEHHRKTRPRNRAIDSGPKRRWWAPWSSMAPRRPDPATPAGVAAVPGRQCGMTGDG